MITAQAQDDDAEWTPRAMLLRRRADAESQGGSAEIDIEEIDALLARLSVTTPDTTVLGALISKESIERLAEDIAIACVDCRTEIVEARHRAMVRLGERLRNPLPNDIKALAALASTANPTVPE